MKNPKNRIDPAQQNTPDIEGYYYEGADGSQTAFWECRADRTSKKHVHDFDEYTIFRLTDAPPPHMGIQRNHLKKATEHPE